MMKKIFLPAIILAAFTACEPQENDLINGYIEGEYVYVAPRAGGVLDEIGVRKGDRVAAGDKLFAVDREIWNLNLRQAETELENARSNYADLSKGKRREELEVIAKQKAQAQALLESAARAYERSRKLIANRNISEAEYEQRVADYESARAKVAELEASFVAGTLAAREDALAVAQNNVEIARQNLSKIREQFSQNQATAKVGGAVEDVYFRLGEYVPAGTPVVSILPPENVKIRFFVPEKQLPKIALGQRVSVFCDAFPQALDAKISFISSKCEFTPPTIYSVGSREKLVFMVEAVFEDKARNLHPGQPVSVKILP